MPNDTTITTSRVCVCGFQRLVARLANKTNDDTQNRQQSTVWPKPDRAVGEHRRKPHTHAHTQTNHNTKKQPLALFSVRDVLPRWRPCIIHSTHGTQLGSARTCTSTHARLQGILISLHDSGRCNGHARRARAPITPESRGPFASRPPPPPPPCVATATTAKCAK